MTEKVEMNKNNSSYDLVWNYALNRVDAWVVQENRREDFLLQSAKQLAENLKQNQKDRKELAQQFSKELSEWVMATREELLTTTTVFQNLFPIRSYEEINNRLDDIQNKIGKMTSSPYKGITYGEYVDNVVSTLEKFVEFRRSSRSQYVSTVKKSMFTLKVYQGKSLKLITSQVKNMFFPVQKYMVPTNEVSSEF
ncbi:hypothetical protein AA0X95_20445 [Bacillus sp. 1P10SD]|uniref:hypothetical protein n=1 Tax=Bacillus sp. 1P10SD TaxID=3132265 RepID=UPI0039A473EF